MNERNDYHEYLYLSERDPDSPEAGFWVDRKELKRECRIRHAWARTIHTFQVRNCFSFNLGKKCKQVRTYIVSSQKFKLVDFKVQ